LSRSISSARSPLISPQRAPVKSVGAAREIIERRLSFVDKGPLFVNENGAVITSAHIGHYLLTRGPRLPIAKFTSHDLRRTFATMLAEMGVALDLVAAIVGH
jgi:integrase